MKRHLIVAAKVDILDDVNFPVGWPVSSSSPTVMNVSIKGPPPRKERLFTYNAGHVPQMPPGMCVMSAMKSPCVYFFRLSIRTLARPSGETVLKSTPI